MSISRSLITGGSAYAVLNSKNIQFTDDCTYEEELVTENVEASLYLGPIDEVYRDLLPKCSGTPLFYDTAQLTTMFPYLFDTNPWYSSGGGTSSPGAPYPGLSDLACSVKSVNGDTVSIASALIGKMPDLELGVAGPVLGKMEIWGVVANGQNPSASGAYSTFTNGNSYSAPAVPGTAVLGRQEFTAAWGSNTGFTSFQAQDKWTITHELKLEAVAPQGRTRCFRLAGYRCMAKCKPIGPTMANIYAALQAQGTGAAGGNRLSANTATSNLVIQGSSSITVTLGNAALKTSGYMFGSKPLRQGELGWVSTLNIASGGTPSTPPLTLA